MQFNWRSAIPNLRWIVPANRPAGKQSRQVHFGVSYMTGMRAKLAVRIAALGAATMGLSACYYDAGVGLGYYDDGYSYYDDSYGCDPYSPFDSYYDCDYGGGFYNIGFGGGWYQDYWYPGYGFYIFDRGGRRYNMHDNHRRYWGGRRHEWYREHHGRRGDHDGKGRRDGHRNYNGSGQHDGQVADGRRGGRNPGAVGNGQNPNWQRDRNSDDRRGDGRGQRRRDWSQNGRDAAQQVPPVATPPAATSGRGDGRGWRRGGDGSAPRATEGNRRQWQAPPAPQVSQGTAAPAPTPQPRAARPSGDHPRAPRGNDRGPREN
jgi:hypothetical protein